MVERLEKIGRIILWLALSCTCAVVVLDSIKQHRVEGELREAMKKAEDQLAEAQKERDTEREKEKKPRVLAIHSMGPFMTSLSVEGAKAQIWFTNASARTGAVCVVGVAMNQATRKESRSMAACQDVGPYASAVHVPLMFAGGDLAETCPKAGACELSIDDLPGAT